MIVREFRATFQSITEPVQVIRSRGKVEVLGSWYPEKRMADPTPVRYAADEPERSGEGT